MRVTLVSQSDASTCAFEYSNACVTKWYPPFSVSCKLFGHALSKDHWHSMMMGYPCIIMLSGRGTQKG